MFDPTQPFHVSQSIAVQEYAQEYAKEYAQEYAQEYARNAVQQAKLEFQYSFIELYQKRLIDFAQLSSSLKLDEAETRKLLESYNIDIDAQA